MWKWLARKIYKHDVEIAGFVFLVGLPVVCALKAVGVFDALDRMF